MNTKNDFEMNIDGFYVYLSDLQKLYQESVGTLKVKLEAIVSDDIDTLNKSIQAQQVFLLKTKAFDGKIEEYMAKLNTPANTLSEMISLLPEEHQLRFYDLLGQFEMTLSEVKFNNEKCQTLLQTKLYMIDKKMKKMDINQQATTYQNNAKETVKSTLVKSFETKI